MTDDQQHYSDRSPAPANEADAPGADPTAATPYESSLAPTDPATGHDKATHVTRSVDLDAGPAAVWDAVIDPERRRAWLDDDDASSRALRIDHVDDGRSLTWTWWRPDDASSASQVHVVLTRLTDGSTRVAVTERLTSPQETTTTHTSRTGLRAESRIGASSAWDCRLLGLELLMVAAGVLVG